jgi:murein L,D-transpeptidase YafK
MTQVCRRRDLLRLCAAGLWPVALWAQVQATPAEVPIDGVRVEKAARKLHLLNQGQIVATFPMVLGGNPVGHKQQEGDRRTPEGRYVLDYKKADSSYYKAIRISYPNAADRASARRRGVNPGGAIMIHGQPNAMGRSPSALALPYDWTDGCVALSNRNMEEVWRRVKRGTPIEILP